MQTFLPHNSYYVSGSFLDTVRLSNQLLEAQIIYTSLTNPDYGWKNHPAVKMWKGYEDSLLFYGICVYWWRYYKLNKNGSFMGCHKSGEFLLNNFIEKGYIISKDIYLWGICEINVNNPAWLGDEALHASHRSALLYKNYNHYSQFGWGESPAIPVLKNKRLVLPYVWPV